MHRARFESGRKVGAPKDMQAEEKRMITAINDSDVEEFDQMIQDGIKPTLKVYQAAYDRAMSYDEEGKAKAKAGDDQFLEYLDEHYPGIAQKAREIRTTGQQRRDDYFLDTHSDTQGILQMRGDMSLRLAITGDMRTLIEQL